MAMENLFNPLKSRENKNGIIQCMSIKDLILVSVADAYNDHDLVTLRSLVRNLQQELLDSTVALTKYRPVSEDDKIMIGHAYHKNLPCYCEFG